MTTTTGPALGVGRTHVTRQAGYTIAIVVNLALLFVANNLLAWDVVPFLTREFTTVLWLIDVSLLATIAVNLAHMWYDPAWFKSTCQIGLGSISMLVAIRMFQVFPFDFSRYEFDWERVTRFVMVLGMIGIGIGIVVETVKLARSFLPVLAASSTSDWDDNEKVHRNERRTK
ncbi:MAG TPA: hypothetical protein VLA91_00815 [Acidimicrobiia bacterium]|nr:hypothetical protein [Acidimicrobiia bacterium]